jgi:hypothetical protein
MQVLANLVYYRYSVSRLAQFASQEQENGKVWHLCAIISLYGGFGL